MTSRARRPAPPARRTATHARRSAHARARRRRHRSTRTAGSVQPSSSGCSSGGSGAAMDVLEDVICPDCPVSQGIGRLRDRSRYARWAPPRPSRPRPSGASRILEAACRVIVREGAHGLRMASVARGGGRLEGARPLLLRDAAGAAAQRVRVLGAALARRARRRARAAPDAAAKARADAARRDRAGPALQRAARARNEVWSSLRSDDELRPLVERSYRTWLARLVGLIDEGVRTGRFPDGRGEPAGWRLAAAADGLDSLLYLGLVDRERAASLMRGAIVLELGTG